jgi:hypothetical protein
VFTGFGEHPGHTELLRNNSRTHCLPRAAFTV